MSLNHNQHNFQVMVAPSPLVMLKPADTIQAATNRPMLAVCMCCIFPDSMTSAIFCAIDLFGSSLGHSGAWRRGRNYCSVFAFHRFRNRVGGSKGNSGSVNIVAGWTLVCFGPVGNPPLLKRFWCVVGIHFHKIC